MFPFLCAPSIPANLVSAKRKFLSFLLLLRDTHFATSHIHANGVSFETFKAVRVSSPVGVKREKENEKV